jgi:hypothetical protein
MTATNTTPTVCANNAMKWVNSIAASSPAAVRLAAMCPIAVLVGPPRIANYGPPNGFPRHQIRGNMHTSNHKTTIANG